MGIFYIWVTTLTILGHVTSSAVLKLSRSAAERRSGSFLEAGAAFLDFKVG